MVRRCNEFRLRISFSVILIPVPTHCLSLKQSHSLLSLFLWESRFEEDNSSESQEAAFAAISRNSSTSFRKPPNSLISYYPISLDLLQMDSREPPQPPPPPHLQSQPPSAPPNMMMGPVSYSSTMHNPNTCSMIGHNSTPMMMGPATARFPFIQQPPPPQSKPSELLSNTSPFDGSSSSALRPCGFNMDSTKKKRGRPRKYSPDGNIALGLAPTPMSSSSAPADLSGTTSGEPSAKKNRGRPPGSGKKQLDALGAGGLGFTPHVIMVKTGEDIASKIMAFSEQGPRAICILSANGAICNATLRQPAMSGGTMHYEGRYEIISLSGSFLVSDTGGCNLMGGLSTSLAAADGKVVGGGVAGTLIAASPVQVIVGSFITEGKKSSSDMLKSGPSSVPASQMLNFGASVTPTSPTSQGASSDSSDDNDDSPFHRGPGPGSGPGPGVYNNVSQPIHNMQWNHHPLWTGQAQQ
ncbi:AT-hook motif nuclear-localized protein 13-like [Senna tora]|uniref:AT-hook motif nuclear-localized protein n=1 Tax=Senna tora TaxID=362788 RepID=A0A834WR10_9FABA|nr:AT-hook motif nuclear-localized protein 13-like [Senna tora]